MLKLIVLNLIIIGTTMAQTNYPKINNEIFKGNFSNAKEMITEILSTNNLMKSERDSLLFEIERHSRIIKDFSLSKESVQEYVKKYIPEVDTNMILEWEQDKSLEFKFIDGCKYYFRRSPSNLFRINKEAKARKELVTGKSKDDLDILLEKIVPQIIDEINHEERIYSKPSRIKLIYKVIVSANKIPEGEVIKCWLPFPRDGHLRQKLEHFTSQDKYEIADNSQLQRSVYFEKVTKSDNSTIFNYELILSNRAVNFNIDQNFIKPYIKNTEYREYTKESIPHITFNDKIRELSSEVVGDEINPYLIAKKIFTWINDNIPWAGAREYSTILNISNYCLYNMHGDCGIKTLLFMTLARFNGIPAKWQSGWMLHPGEKNLHDWCEIYFEGYGWVPVDQSFGIIDSENPLVKYFYLGGIDQYRFIVNDGYSSPFSPPKQFPRSETVDFQRGEVEWSGGNLYFDEWDYSMEIEYLE